MDNSKWGNYLVGDKNIRTILSSSAGSAELWSGLMDLATSLQIREDLIQKLRTSLATGLVSHPSALVQILQAWRAEFSSDATLSALISALVANRLAVCAVSLRNKFDHRHGITTPRIAASQEESLNTRDDTAELLVIPNTEQSDSQQRPHSSSLSHDQKTDPFPKNPDEPKLPANLVELQHWKGNSSNPGTGIFYNQNHILGTGATSIVYEGEYLGNPAAVKIVKSEDPEAYKKERNVLQHMRKTIEENNLNIVALFCWQELEPLKSYVIVMERAICNLADRVKTLKSSAKPSQLASNAESQWKSHQLEITGFIHGIAKGLKWMHECENPIIHRDVKPENILICSTSTGEMAKLGDFGVSRELGTTTGAQGTLWWMAPEAIDAYNDDQKFHATKAVDIFSLGMTAHFAMSLGSHPFKYSLEHKKSVERNISDIKVMPDTLGNSNYAADHLLQWMMSKPVKGRPNIQQVVQHPCFWDLKRAKEFILGVALCFDGALGSSAAKEIDDEYKQRVGEPVNWVKKLDARVQRTLFDYRRNNYSNNSDSIMKLVVLMRDKYVHHAEMIKHAETDEFKSNRFFDEDKYWNYFLNLYPELVIHLFCHIAKQKDSLLNEVKKGYTVGFDNVPDWKYKHACETVEK
ncbi:unnamed protein product [Orchesella dallaii]|uniref:Uncharacterized protein n=1 Tax=Orchesella dallaii TaxID=48710 RepID=A0ABP1RAF4_9HEXA